MIDAIGLDAARPAAAVDPSAFPFATQPAQLLDQAAQSPEQLKSLSQDFDRMMQSRPDALGHNDAARNDHATVASQFVRSGETVLQHTFTDIQRLMLDAPNLTLPELTSRHIAITMEVAMTQFQFNSTTYVAQSAKSGLQTLMKNQ